MFILDDGSAAGPLLIPQTSHAWLAWQVALRWGNRRFGRPEPRAEALAAVLLHDYGWTEFERRPAVGVDGRPAAFDRMPVADHLAIWEESVERAALAARFAGLLVASHFVALAAMKEADAGDDAEMAEAVGAWRSRLEERAAGWRCELAGDRRFAQFLDGPRWAACRAVLACCDRLAVFLCAGWERPFELPAARLTVHCEGRRPAQQLFAGTDELAAALAAAPTERASFTLLRPSAVGALD